MNDAATITAVVSVAACLVLAVRAVRGRGMSFNRAARMALVWIVIIAALAVVLARMTP
jgi:hypothetical protein